MLDAGAYSETLASQAGGRGSLFVRDVERVAAEARAAFLQLERRDRLDVGLDAAPVHLVGRTGDVGGLL